jgi:hypothetical protein
LKKEMKKFYSLLLSMASAEFIQVGDGDCQDFEQIELGSKSSGTECMSNCYDRGYFMATWNGNCYCESNPEG